MVYSLLGPVLLGEGDPQVVVGFGKVRFDAQGLAIVLDGLIESAYTPERITEIVVCGCVVWFELEGLSVMLDHQVQLVPIVRIFGITGLSTEQNTRDDVHCRTLRIQFQRPSARVLGFPVCPCLRCSPAFHRPRMATRGEHLRNRFQFRQRAIGLAVPY